ncbi:hypothetical protein FA822_20990 [Escherichia coli]|nr:hypothetical protein [Escherichia coli]EFD4962115.1 hypothetical protein [Escherichia coli]
MARVNIHCPRCQSAQTEPDRIRSVLGRDSSPCLSTLIHL